MIDTEILFKKSALKLTVNKIKIANYTYKVLDSVDLEDQLVRIPNPWKKAKKNAIGTVTESK